MATILAISTPNVNFLIASGGSVAPNGTSLGTLRLFSGHGGTTLTAYEASRPVYDDWALTLADDDIPYRSESNIAGLSPAVASETEYLLGRLPLEVKGVQMEAATVTTEGIYVTTVDTSSFVTPHRHDGAFNRDIAVVGLGTGGSAAAGAFLAALSLFSVADPASILDVSLLQKLAMEAVGWAATLDPLTEGVASVGQVTPAVRSAPRSTEPVPPMVGWGATTAGEG